MFMLWSFQTVGQDLLKCGVYSEFVIKCCKCNLALEGIEQWLNNIGKLGLSTGMILMSIKVLRCKNYLWKHPRNIFEKIKNTICI